MKSRKRWVVCKSNKIIIKNVELDYKLVYTQVLHELKLKFINIGYMIHFTLITNNGVGENTIFNLTLSNGDIKQIPVRNYDCLINATLLCEAGGKNFNDYRNDINSKQYIDNLYKFNDFEINYIIMCPSGVWVSRLIAIDLTRWIDTSFQIQFIIYFEQRLINKFYNESNFF